MIVFTARELAMFNRAREVLSSDFSESQTIPKLARKLGTNATKLKSGFRLLYGTTIFAYRNRHRMDRAMHLLVAGETADRNCCPRCGLSPSGQFHFGISRSFRAYPKAGPPACHFDTRTLAGGDWVAVWSVAQDAPWKVVHSIGSVSAQAKQLLSPQDEIDEIAVQGCESDDRYLNEGNPSAAFDPQDHAGKRRDPRADERREERRKPDAVPSDPGCDVSYELATLQPNEPGSCPGIRRLSAIAQ